MRTQLKTWGNYSLQERKDLLNYWWHSYGQGLYSLEELSRFNELIESQSDKIFVIAVNSYTGGFGLYDLIAAIRSGTVDNLLKDIPDLETITDRDFIQSEEDFCSILVGGCNNPEPSILMDSESFQKQLVGVIKNTEIKN